MTVRWITSFPSCDMTDEERKKWNEELAANKKKVEEAAAKGFNTIYTDSGQQVPNAESPKANNDHQQQDTGGEGG